MNQRSVSSDMAIFAKRLKEYKRLIDDDIATYAKAIEKTTLQYYGANARLATDAYLQILARGGKRIRGALVMTGYEMCGGTDTRMIVEAARAIEMIHAYILIVDDIQDRSMSRRGGPTAHVALADYHRQHQLAGESAHFGISMALNSAIAGAHSASMNLANLNNVEEELRIKVVSIVNRTMVVTAHGQSNDIMNEVAAETSREDVERTMEWKTAHYTFLNPLCTGMVLAGADCHATDAIAEYALQAGKAFQITDDILGTFGTEFESGKSPLDDIREGKRTILTIYALEHAETSDKNFLIHMLGNAQLTPAEFARCKDILVSSGALDYAKKQATTRVQAAIKSLDGAYGGWNKDGVQFLRGLAEYLQERQS